MEALLFILFVIFSLVSSYLERRKRRREVELARQSQEQRAKRQEQELDVDSEEEWIPDFDPFADKKIGQELATYPTTERELQDVESEIEESERRNLEAERNLVAAERLIQETEGRSQDAVVDAVRRGPSVFSAGLKRSTSSRSKNQYKIDARRAREALVFAEIIGPPISERDK